MPRAPAKSSRAVAPREAPAASGRAKTVLVVEDQAEVREVIETSLRHLGYRILTAPDGVEARNVLESGKPIDLLLTDIVMPNGVSGVELGSLPPQAEPRASRGAALPPTGMMLGLVACVAPLCERTKGTGAVRETDERT